MGGGPEPYHLPIRNAYNCVLGEIPGAVMTGDGTLLNKDTFNWATWEPKVGNDDHALKVIRTTTAMRCGPGKDYLVYGRMQRPAVLENVEVITWEHSGRVFRVPAVFDAAWQSPAGRLGVVLANWTELNQNIQINDARLGENVTVYLSANKLTSESIGVPHGMITVSVPPHSCVLVEAM